MFDFGLSELLLVGAVALVVLGPERLPQAARMAGNLVGRLQRLVAGVKQELNTQVELEELRKAKQEFENAAAQFQEEVKHVGKDAQDSLNEITDGLKPWERLPEQRTPADFGVDAQGNPLPEAGDNGSDGAKPADSDEMPSVKTTEAAAETLGEAASENTAEYAAETTADSDQAWRDYLTGAKPAAVPQVSYTETVLPAAETAAPFSTGLHSPSLRQQAMRRKRDVRPKFRAQPKLRIRKK
ncbi:Sec-independent protein translocase protein TatB [Neisseria animalis]|uniref:Sec-independent protein translocase protein TatB n=1 Tax=Neisseria animalis TaxID=492 RepID=A0A5P3MQ34_NEIAN|nr:Sec-independent protein translocase protein TatB [Neisseria animalis]QEY23618.1 twin-arginine translocase subunit TatB [Neisseria animalis]ROW32763.1 twin-arginine translocase subunit TatB [Neisseria animalis]VEE09347.1 sec-independent protein translocase component [Neisseria animalis]